MKATSTLQAAACALACLAFTQSAMADFRDKAREVFVEHQDAVFGLRAILKMTVTMNGQQAGVQEQPLWTNATAIEDGLLVVSYKSLKPDVAANAPNGQGLKIETELSDLKLVDANGDEFDAKLVLHDEALGVAFVAVDPSGENAADFKSMALDFANESKLEHLQQLISIGRMGENMRYQGQLKIGEVTAIVERPRMMVHVADFAPSSAVFNESGQMVGLIVVDEVKRGQQPLPLMLPFKYIHGLLDQAKEKQAALSKG